MAEGGEGTSQEQQRKTEAVSPVVKFSVFTGIFLLRIISSIPWIWGNLVVYVTSYYYAKGDYWSCGLTSWVIGVEMITFNAAVTIGSSIARKIGLRTTLLLGLLLFNGGIFLTSLAVKHSVVTLCLTFGAATGFAGGLVESIQLILVVRWTERYYGLSTSSVQSALVLGGFVLNLLLTCYINPNNEEANTTVDRKAVFTQQDVIDRVPSVFLVYGMLSTILNFLGFFLVRNSPDEKHFITKMTNCLLRSNSSPGERVRLTKSEENVTIEGLTEARSDISSRSQHVYNSHDNDDDTLLPHYHGNWNNDDSTTYNNCDNNDIDNNTESKNDDVNSISDLTPRQVLRQRSFYALLFFKAVIIYGFFIFNNFYKTFGLLYIPDDHFLTAVVMVKCLLTPGCTWIAGFAVDKLGIKPTLIVISSIFCILTSFFYLTPINKWLYFFSCVLSGCTLYTLFCVTGACCVKLFGETHFTTIFGMTFISGYFMVPLLPLFTGWLISSLGWFALFGSIGFMALVNVFVLLWGLPP